MNRQDVEEQLEARGVEVITREEALSWRDDLRACGMAADWLDEDVPLDLPPEMGIADGIAFVPADWAAQRGYDVGDNFSETFPDIARRYRRKRQW